MALCLLQRLGTKEPFQALLLAELLRHRLTHHLPPYIIMKLWVLAAVAAELMEQLQLPAVVVLELERLEHSLVCLHRPESPSRWVQVVVVVRPLGEMDLVAVTHQ
jgi:hypothetical protein